MWIWIQRSSLCACGGELRKAHPTCGLGPHSIPVHTILVQVNAIGIVQETSSDSGMHDRAITVNVSCKAETHPHHTV